jgi:outer membrane protein OmpA-like peptidoglycan-associated protein/polyisoprenoid-binding protein YceI
MLTTLARVCLVIALFATAMGAGKARAQDFLNQEWVLNPRLSNVYMQTVKNNAVFETLQFTAVEGNVSKNAEVTVKIELNSIETGTDVRNVRMRFLLFETYKFPYAEISAKLDKVKLKALATETRLSYPLTFTVGMHGVVKEFKSVVWVTRISDTAVSVSTIEPIIVTAESFGFAGGIAKLSESVGGIPIASAASITFDLVFASGSLKPALEAARAAREKSRAEEASSAISAEACETRFAVISKTGAIYFKTGSADLDLASAPLLNSVVDIANRCPAVKIDVEGHTDNIGTQGSNRELSELRARSVVDYLKRKGVAAQRIQSAGYGDTRPNAPNDTETNRSRNRRIEFNVRKD